MTNEQSLLAEWLRNKAGVLHPQSEECERYMAASEMIERCSVEPLEPRGCPTPGACSCSADRIEFLQTWMRTPNPMLGNVAPLDMLKMGRGWKLAQFIEAAYETDQAPEAERK